ncbi:MAG: Cro/CI family transcriptional regulator [Rhodoferax sp.]|nr:Cro/CI family transcriptional regulator [Rhodoferax sp.]
MKKKHAIQLAGSAKALADLLGLTQGAVSQWSEDLPPLRMYQLRDVKPEWFAQQTRQNEHKNLLG